MGAMELYIQLKELGCDLLKRDLKEFLSGDRTPQPQDESKVTVAAKIQKNEALLQWQDSAQDLHNKVRGLNMGGPFAMALFRGKTLKVHKSFAHENTSDQQVGEIVQVEKNSFFVQCGKGLLELLEVQPESKAKINAGDFIRGYQPNIGEKLV